jgi:hypothetical protein
VAHAELRDVRSGETLVVNELTRAGLLVVIEPMAIWCTNCRTQQNEARDGAGRPGRDDIVYISLDVDPNETEPDLARYADERDYPWHFVVASREVARSLAEVFGDQVLSPPSTPKIVVARDGRPRSASASSAPTSWRPSSPPCCPRWRRCHLVRARLRQRRQPVPAAALPGLPGHARRARAGPAVPAHRPSSG